MTKHETGRFAERRFAEMTEGPWALRRNQDPTYPDLATYDVLAPNPDAGKVGIPYAGKHLMVAADLDSLGDARLIAAAPEMLALVREHVCGAHLGGSDNCSAERAYQIDNCKAARALLARIEGNT